MRYQLAFSLTPNVSQLKQREAVMWKYLVFRKDYALCDHVIDRL